MQIMQLVVEGGFISGDQINTKSNKKTHWLNRIKIEQMAGNIFI